MTGMPSDPLYEGHGGMLRQDVCVKHTVNIVEITIEKIFIDEMDTKV